MSGVSKIRRPAAGQDRRQPTPSEPPPRADIGAGGETSAEPPSLGPLPGYLGYKLRQAQVASFRHLDRLSGTTDLSPGRFSLLTAIARNPGITQTQIAKCFGLDKSTLSPVIEQLVKRRLVARKRSKTDGRAYGLSLTAAGDRLLDAKRAEIEAQETLLAETMTRREHARLLELLDRIVAALDRAP